MTGKAWSIACFLVLLAGCSKPSPQPGKAEVKEQPAYFKVDPGTAATVTGVIRYTGKKPRLKPIDMSGDPACLESHHGRVYDESLVVNAGGDLANVFVYVKSGLEGKTFETSETPVDIDQKGCLFVPRVLGIQTGQTLRVTNSDAVTHNIHPLAQVNREWNHSQGAGEEPLARKFARPEVMIPVKCNIHSWMRAYIGVLAHPYFAVSHDQGTFEIRNLPPGDYVVEAWHESLGVQEQHIQVAPSAKVELKFTFKGE